MTESEKQAIVEQVLAALSTNSRTIDQLTEVSSLTSSAYFEVSGGRKISYSNLASIIGQIAADGQSDLQTAIDRKELQSVSFTAGESSATLTIKSVGKTITCSVPIATTTASGIITAADKTKILTAYNTATDLQGRMNTAEGNISSQGGRIDTAEDDIDNIEAALTKLGKSFAGTVNHDDIDDTTKHVYGAIHKVVDSIGADFGWLITDRHFCGQILQQTYITSETVKNGKLQGYHADGNWHILTRIFNKSSNDIQGQGIVTETVAPGKWSKWYLVAGGELVTGLAEAQAAIKQHTSAIAANSGAIEGVAVYPFDGFYVSGDIPFGEIRWQQLHPGFVEANVTGGVTYVNDSRYQDYNVHAGLFLPSPKTDRLYRYAGQLYHIVDGKMVAFADASDISELQGNIAANAKDIAANAEKIAGIAIFPFNFIIDHQDVVEGETFMEAGQIMWATSSHRFFIGDENNKAADYVNPEYQKADGVGADYKWLNTHNIFRLGGTLYHATTDADGYYALTPFADAADLEALKEKVSAIGNCYNVTNTRRNATTPRPTEEGTSYYDELATAIAYTYQQGKAALGMQITFALAANSWKTYQYVGTDTTEANFKNTDNWVDLAGLSAGTEPMVNLNELCKDTGMALAGDIYDLALALRALKKKIETSGINYVKPGMIITYKTGEHEWETKQLIGEANDYEELGLWSDFGGGGGSDVETSDEPADGGTDAFSTGGAYAKMPVDVEGVLDEETGDTTYYLVNKAGERVGDHAITVPAAGSGGSTSARSLSIAFDHTPLYAAYGSDLTVRAAIRSINVEGEQVTTNGISSLRIIDGSTGVELYAANVDKHSSASLTDYTFTLDFTPYFSASGNREFIVEATDDTGYSNTKRIKVFAVDVTVKVKDVQQLYYSADNCLTVGQNSMRTFTLFNFPGCTAAAPISAKAEMLVEGEWVTIYEGEVKDKWTRSVSVNPSNVGGHTLTHGAYPLRVQGTDINSGVSGNIVYTAIMCLEAGNTTPLVALRYNDTKGDGTIRLYDNAEVEVAAYTPGSNATAVALEMDGEVIATLNCLTSDVTVVRKQVQGYAADGSQMVSFRAVSGSAESYTVELRVLGSAIDAELKAGARFAYDFSTRSNAEADHSISDNGVTMDVAGSNYSSNGFKQHLGEMALAVKENVKATVDYRPFEAANIKTQGLAVQFAFATANIADADALLLECYDAFSGAGFYVKGNAAGIYCTAGNHQREERKFRCGEKITMAVVVEPVSLGRTAAADGVTYASIKLYLNGEQVACIGYNVNASAILTQSKAITLDGTHGDIYLYYMLAYNNYYDWHQAFSNYLVKLADTDAMVEEYDFEDVLDGGTPSLSSLKAKGYPYYVVVAPQETFSDYDGGTDTSTNYTCTLYYYNPQYPCLNFKAEGVRWRRQGTTSAQRPVKNDRFYLNKATSVTLLNPDNSTQLGRDAIALAAKKYVRVTTNAIPVQVLTVKVDYSDSSNANDGAICDMMNAAFRAAGDRFLTPAQRAYDGTFTKDGLTVTGCRMDHSTKNHPIAAFRATQDNLSDAWFHAKGNWKEDKGEQVALGFRDTPGYNLGCRNYGDFVEFFGTEGESLDDIETRFKATSGLDTSKLYLLSLYCGRNYRFMRYRSGAWTASTGSMSQNAQGKWVVTGDVLNPVTGFELLRYSDMCWWQGVSSVNDMMQMQSGKSAWVEKLVNSGKISASAFPAWTQYFECMVDDDQLQIDLALGRKVPYDIYAALRFMDSCDYTSVEEATWKPLWRDGLRNYTSVRSMYAYTAFSDYKAATDQRAKNMQPMFFLEDGHSVVNGVYSDDYAVKMYLNKIYDCDTCDGKDNDGGCTVDAECDPNKPTVEGGYSNPYAGWGSILFNDIDRCPVVLDDDGTELSLTDVVKTMRSAQATNEEGVQYVPFSPEGATYHFVTKRLKHWPKLISSYDGQRKYIDSVERSNSVYFYALQGLGLTALPQFIEQRWNYRDGYYQTGGFVGAAHSITGRTAAADGAGITVKAAKSGYFGVGNEKEGNISEAVYLEAGETYRFTQFDHNAGAMLWVYQADRLAELDFSELTLSGFQFGKLSLVETLKIGSEAHADAAGLTYEPLTSVSLGSLPFLRTLDVRNTSVKTIDATGCPRLEVVLAEGTSLTQCSLAQTAPVETLHLPATVTRLDLVNLPSLTYPGGLEIAGLSALQRLWVEGCPGVDAKRLLEASLTSGATLTQIRLLGINTTASVTLLQRLMDAGIAGLDANGNPYSEHGQCSGLSGRWMLTELIGDAKLSALNAYFPVLNVYNSQFTGFVFDDTMDDPANITNLSNDSTGDNFHPSDHILAIRSALIPVKGKLDGESGKWVGQRISEDNYRQLANGDDFDYSDTHGNNFDIMMLCPAFWYKGVNDYKTQKKYIFWSSLDKNPLSSADTVRRSFLCDCIHTQDSAVKIDNVVVGTSTLENANVIVTAPGYNTYTFNVEGMKQVRWPGLNSSTLGAVFLDERGVVVGKFNMAISNAMFDFTAGSDYVFCDVPANAKTIVFASTQTSNDLEVIAVDSRDVEAIEPDWVRNGQWLCGVYQASVDSLRRLRSISGAKTAVGTGTSGTSPEWLYDANGRVLNTPVSTLNYTHKDFQNLAMLRGDGYQLIDYEMSKLLANLWMCLNGTRNVQLKCGYGSQPGGMTGLQDAIGNADTALATVSEGNKILGIENFVGCNWELIDNVAVNVVSFPSYLSNLGAKIASDPVDAKWHIYDPIAKTERVVQGVTNTSVCIHRVKNGRFCDTIASKCRTDYGNNWTTNYCDAFYYKADKCLCVGRSENSRNAYGGIIFLNALNSSSGSSSTHGTRLAFRGDIEITD